LEEKHTVPYHFAKELTQDAIGWIRKRITKNKSRVCDQVDGGQHVSYGQGQNQNVVGFLQEHSVTCEDGNDQHVSDKSDCSDNGVGDLREGGYARWRCTEAILGKWKR